SSDLIRHRSTSLASRVLRRHSAPIMSGSFHQSTRRRPNARGQAQQPVSRTTRRGGGTGRWLLSFCFHHGPANQELAKLAKALGHPARVRILRMLSRREARVCSQIIGELPLAQSTVSEHLRILKDAGLIRGNQDGTRVGYCIDNNALRRLRALTALI